MAEIGSIGGMFEVDEETADLARAYYTEILPVYISRFQLLALAGAGILALKHPEMPELAAQAVRDVIRQVVPAISAYAPEEVLIEWEQVLNDPAGSMTWNKKWNAVLQALSHLNECYHTRSDEATTAALQTLMDAYDEWLD